MIKANYLPTLLKRNIGGANEISIFVNTSIIIFADEVYLKTMVALSQNWKKCARAH